MDAAKASGDRQDTDLTGPIHTTITQYTEGRGYGHCYSLDELFDTSKYRTSVRYGVEYERRRKEITAKFKEAEDELMLGDQQKAILMLKELSELKV